ncbi:MAG: helix-turn-helix transcriptional regulator [Treponema sp.]|nr:helix-turn-helix domain-containing protein [Spirochaetia bacterium]MDD7458456.1 helix-turn-helix transcriptional regulator [Spirochaetales bacterium]MDY5812629.1 helix-turn-helix transcriptional regulator [Treponema sp.]
MNIGQAIIVLRKQKSLSQEKLAFESEISRHYMYELENNKSCPTVQTLEKIANVLDIKVSELIQKAESL